MNQFLQHHLHHHHHVYRPVMPTINQDRTSFVLSSCATRDCKYGNTVDMPSSSVTDLTDTTIRPGMITQPPMSSYNISEAHRKPRRILAHTIHIHQPKPTIYFQSSSSSFSHSHSHKARPRHRQPASKKSVPGARHDHMPVGRASKVRKVLREAR